MANATGRTVAPLALSSEERAHLERQVRRRRVARSLSERCRIILRCADRASTKDCRECALKPRCTKGAKRIVARNLYEANARMCAD